MSFSKRRMNKLAHSLGEAQQMCLDFAAKKHNRGTKRIADLMGVNLDTLYKWLGEDRMPAHMLRPFENACGVTYVTEYHCASAHLLAVEMPVGKKLTQTDVMELQKQFANAVALLIEFHEQNVAGEEAAASLTHLMGAVGWHRENVERRTEPQLPMFGESE